MKDFQDDSPGNVAHCYGCEVGAVKVPDNFGG